jgi:hypothetical protein
MSFVEKVKSSSGDLVYIVRGQDQGMDAWHYVRVKDKAVLPIFLRKADGGPIDVSQYGEILYSGWGKNPPEDIVNQVQKQYG